MMTIREYKRAESLEEAWQLNQKKPNRILGGMIWLKMETINVGTAIDLSGLGLDTIEETEEGFSIGAMVTLRQLEQHQGLAAYTHGAMREAVRHIVGVQLRNLATVGGSIYSRFGFSDVLTMFLAMDCDVELYKGGILPLQEYAQRPYDRDILVRLIVKKTPMQLYYQSVRNSQTDIPVLTCAAARLADGCYRIAIGARPLKAVLYEFPAENGMPAQELALKCADAVKNGLLPAAEFPAAEIISADEINGKTKRKIAVGALNDGAEDLAGLRQGKGAEKGGLRKKKRENKCQQQKISHELLALNNGAQQRNEQIESRNHKEEPHVIVTVEKLLQNKVRRASLEVHHEDGVERRPEDERCDKARHVLFQNVPDALRAGEEQRAADHHKNRNSPADGTVVKVEGLPGS